MNENLKGRYLWVTKSIQLPKEKCQLPCPNLHGPNPKKKYTKSLSRQTHFAAGRTRVSLPSLPWHLNSYHYKQLLSKWTYIQSEAAYKNEASSAHFSTSSNSNRTKIPPKPIIILEAFQSLLKNELSLMELINKCAKWTSGVLEEPETNPVC